MSLIKKKVQHVEIKIYYKEIKSDEGFEKLIILEDKEVADLLKDEKTKKDILGDVANISRLFIEFQQHLYKRKVA